MKRNETKLERLYRATFITFMTFTWVYFGMHVVIHIINR